MKWFSVTGLVVFICVFYASADGNQRQSWSANEGQEKSWQFVGHSPKASPNLFVDDEHRSVNNKHEIRASADSAHYFDGANGRSPLSCEGRINHVRRFRRQIAPINPNKPFTLNSQVTHGQGVTGSARLWESQNQRHQLHGMGSYGQVFTPYGNSQPNYGAGLGYVYRF